ncbi:MAG: NPCBM/NEW2 domain-containing protein [Pirellulales bacterium]
MWNLLSAIALVVAAPPVEAQSLDGQVTQGNLVAVDQQAVTLETPEGEKQFTPNELLSVRMHPGATPAEATPPEEQPAAPAQPALIRVELIDGSHLPAEAFTTQGDTASIKLAGGQTVELATSAIAAVRMQPHDEKLAALWEQFEQLDVAGDMVVIRTRGAADYLEGVLQGTDDKNVVLKFDGDDFPIARERVVGLIYYRRDSQQPKPICTVRGQNELRLVAREVRLQDESLHVVTTAGAELSLPLTEVAELDFSRGKIEYLSNMTPGEVQWTPYFGLPAESLAALQSFGEPRRDQALEGGPLLLDGRSYARGLALRSRTRLTYRLPEGFRELTATAGIDDRLDDRGHVRLVIEGDGRTLFDQPIAGSDDPVPLRLDIAGVRDLMIFVDYGENLDIADHLDLCEARISK